MGRRLDELLERAGALPVLQARADRFLVAQKAQGSRVYDIDNIGYVDYVGGGGSAIVGFANQFVLDAVKKVLLNGIPEGFHVPQEVELAGSLGNVLPWVGGWWFCRNHDEALGHVLGWVAARTGRRQLLALDGGPLLSGGGRDEVVREVPGWDLDRIEAALTAGASKIAALVLDPVMSRVGVVPPPEGALAAIAAACRRNDVLLVFDERVSGFRVDRGGAVAWSGVEPDAAVYGGSLGGGFPIGVVAFRGGLDGIAPRHEERMPTPHPVSLAAADAVLSILKNDSVYARLESRTDQVVEGILALAARFSRPMTVNRVGSVFALYVGNGEVADVASARGSDHDAYRRVVRALVDERVLLPQEPCAPAFLSSAHGAKDVDETLEAFERVLLKLHHEDLP